MSAWLGCEFSGERGLELIYEIVKIPKLNPLPGNDIKNESQIVERGELAVASLGGRAAIFSGESEMAFRMREFDWSQTSLGPLETWPQSLRTSVNLILNSQHPMWIGWGPSVTFLYNDAYVSVLGEAKHPWALGRPASEVWAEIWDVCGPLAWIKCFRRAEATFVNDVRLFMRRGPDFIEETFYSFSYSPIRDEAGRVAGLFCPSLAKSPPRFSMPAGLKLCQSSQRTPSRKRPLRPPAPALPPHWQPIPTISRSPLSI